nr:hypothetical protein [Pseudonocardia acidicola]
MVAGFGGGGGGALCTVGFLVVAVIALLPRRTGALGALLAMTFAMIGLFGLFGLFGLIRANAQLRAGAVGFVVKDSPPEQLVDAVRGAHRAEAVRIADERGWS